MPSSPSSSSPSSAPAVSFLTSLTPPSSSTTTRVRLFFPYLKLPAPLAASVFGLRLHRLDVSWRRITKRNDSALVPLVPRSSANGGSHDGGGTTQATPAASPPRRRIESMYAIGSANSSSVG